MAKRQATGSPAKASSYSSGRWPRLGSQRPCQCRGWSLVGMNGSAKVLGDPCAKINKTDYRDEVGVEHKAARGGLDAETFVLRRLLQAGRQHARHAEQDAGLGIGEFALGGRELDRP